MKDFEKEFDEIEKMKEDFAGYYYHNVPDLYQIQEWFSEYLTVSTNRTEEKMQKKITEIVNNMPDCFPERESDEYERAYRDAKSYILTKLKK
jgi:hypothetical protein